MAKFENAKVGDRVFDLLKGWGTIVEIRKNEEYPIYVNADIDSFCTFTLEGKRYVKDVTPTLFWNEFHVPTEEEDKKTFDLVEYLKENLKPKEFVCGEYNYYYFFWANDEEWSICNDVLNQDIKVYFDVRSEDFINMLNKNKITPQQLRNAYRELGWL